MLIQSLQDLQSMSKKNGIITIKPRVIFQAMEKKFNNASPMKLLTPSSKLGSITMLEASILISLIKLLEPSKVFEFGTFLGYSTSLFAKNTHKNCSIFSIDLGEDVNINESIKNASEEELHINDKINDNYLSYLQNKVGTYYIDSCERYEKEKISLLLGDSRKLDIQNHNFNASMDMIFIDGGHEYSIIENDTHKARQMLTEKGIIIWHDYNSSIHHDVSNYLKTISKQNLILHIENTLIAIQMTPDAMKNFFSAT